MADGFDPISASATAIVAAIANGATTARAVTEAHLDRIGALNPTLRAYTDITADRARAAADAVDRARAAGQPLGPLAGVPFAVKNLLDLKGLVTRAGSKINRDHAPATADATVVTRLEAAGAVCLGALNMGEYAYDFTGQNAHDGNALNPHDLTRMSGGSSGGSGTAAAAGLATLTIGSDTNGSIRVPASLCGLFGLKPTYGRVTRGGTFPFVSSLDHIGPLARCTDDLAASLAVMEGVDPLDPTTRAAPPARPVLPVDALRIAIADDHFARNGKPEAFAAVAAVASALGATRTVTLPDAPRARAAAYLITMAEGAALHVDRLRTRPHDFDPDVRDRLLAGALLPADWLIAAQKLRRAYRAAVIDLFNDVDIILAPATPAHAPRGDEKTFVLDGVELPVRPNMGVYTQPISFIGLPVVAVPVWLEGAALPIGVQIIAAPWADHTALHVARHLETLGTVKAPVAVL